MISEEFRTAFAAAVKRAEDHVDDDLAPEREKATRYYNGEPFGNEEEGRSQVVMTEVRDTIASLMPTLLRVFAGSERSITFAANRPGQEPFAEEATLGVQYWFFSECDGFRVLHDSLKDALVRKIGIVTWRWESRHEVTGCVYEDVDENGLLKLAAGPDVIKVKAEETDTVAGPDGEAEKRYRAEVVRRVRISRPLVEAVPPEEFIFTPGTHALDTTLLVGRRVRMMHGDLIALGLTEEQIGDAESIHDEGEFDETAERAARDPSSFNDQDSEGRTGPTNRLKAWFCFYRYDDDDDGVPELYETLAVGTPGNVVRKRLADEIPYAVGCPDPEAHSVLGLSIADYVGDLQLIKSNVMRGTLDSLSETLTPRLAVVEGQVDIDDLLNPEVGAIIRQRAPGMVQPLATPFVGAQAMPLIGYLDMTREQRTGITKTSQGVDGDVLQSTTAKAVDATVTGSQERKELITRVLAEMFVRRIYKGLLRLLVKYQQGPMYIPVGDTLRAMDPSTWDIDMRVSSVVGMSRGTDEDKLGFLGAVAAKQEQIIQTLGIENPLCGLNEYRATLAEMLAIKGYKDASRFFKDPTAAPPQQPQQQSPQADPAIIVAQADMAKAQMQFALEKEKITLDREKTLLQDDRERDKLAVETEMKRAELTAKLNAQIDMAAIKAETDAARDANRVANGG